MPLREDGRWQRRARQRFYLTACHIHNQTALLLAAVVTKRPSWVFDPASLKMFREQENARERERRGLPPHERPWRERLSVKTFDIRRRKDPYEMFKEDGEYKFAESLRLTYSEFEVLYGMGHTEEDRRQPAASAEPPRLPDVLQSLSDHVIENLEFAVREAQ